MKNKLLQFSDSLKTVDPSNYNVKDNKRCKKVHILLLEDDETLGKIITRYLEMNSYNVIWKTSGEGGINVINETGISYFDLIITDFNMHLMTGLDFAKEIKKQYDIEIPVILHTSDFDMVNNAEEVINDNSNAITHILGKDIENLEKTVNHVLWSPEGL